MREIEFRGRALKSKLWVRGYYWTNENGNHFIRQTVDLNGYFRIADIEVNPETVGQYTGLKDKNEVKIYGGDITAINFLRATKRGKVVIKYEDKYAGFVLSQTGDKTHEYESLGDYQMENVEVIGNIHDNPELLERKD